MKKFLVAAVLVAVSVYWIKVYAGTLTPPSGEPSARFYTLSEIYDFITANTAATEGGHSFAFSESLTSGGKTLTEIYNALASLISADKVKSGTTYLGTAGTLVPSGGNATPNYVLTGKTFFGGSQADWVLQNGAMANNGAFGLTPGSADQAVAAGYYSGGTLAGDADLISGNIKSGANIFGVAGDSNVVDTSTGDAAVGDILSGKIAWVDGQALTGTLAAGYTYGDNSAAYVLGTAAAPGTALVNLFNGSKTGGGYPGGSQANGGVDDYNAGQDPPADRYSGSWTVCFSGNDYCGTGTNSADARDDSTGLVWSLPCNGAGCDSFSDSLPMTYTWTASSSNTYSNSFSTVQNDIVDASVLCSGGDHGISGWYLPSQKQYLQAYIDGSYGNLEAAGTNRAYWSATTIGHSVTTAILGYPSIGISATGVKSTTKYYVRCVWAGD